MRLIAEGIGINISRWFRRRRTQMLSVLFVLATLAAQTGCVLRSVEPLYEEAASPVDRDLVLDQGLVGSWWYADKECSWTLAFAPPAKGDFTYAATMTAAPGCKSSDVPKRVTRYEAHVVQLDNKRFLDVSPSADDVCNPCLALHTFFLISMRDRQLTLTPVDGEWLKDAIAKGTVTLAHLNDSLTMTASSRDLKAFVRKYADDPAAFKPLPDFVFQRK